MEDITNFYERNEGEQLDIVYKIFSSPSEREIEFMIAVASSNIDWGVRAKTYEYLPFKPMPDTLLNTLASAIYSTLTELPINITVSQFTSDCIQVVSAEENLIELCKDLIISVDDLRWNILASLENSEDLNLQWKEALIQVVNVSTNPILINDCYSITNNQFKNEIR